MDNKINTETRKLKLEIEIPYIYYEALIANPSMKNNLILQKINKSAFDTLTKAYNNPRVLPAAVKQYLEDKYGKPVILGTKPEETQTKKGKQKDIKSNQKLEETTDTECVFDDEKY